MADRQRLTWPNGGKAASQPVLPSERAASAHPQTPDEGAAHPAYQPDPGEHDYENGDTSSWAEDPTKGPYPNSAHPATPDEGPAHPAHKAAARDLKASVELRAAKCIRVAQALLGTRASVKAVEDQALQFMYMSDAGLTATLKRLGKKADDDEDDDDEPEAKTAGDDEDEDDDEPKEAKKKAKKADDDEDDDDKPDFLKDKESKKKAKKADDDEDDDDKDEPKEAKKKAGDDDDDKDDDKPDFLKDKESKKKASDPLSQILAALGGIETRLATLESGKAPKVADDEALLASMLAEEGMDTPKAAAEDDVETMLASMLADEGMTTATQAPVACDDDMPMDPMDPMDPMTIDMDMGVDDPMGMYAGEGMDDAESAMLAQLYASDVNAGDDDEDEDKDEGEEKKASKTAGPRQQPRPKKASSGASRLGGFQREAAAGGDIEELAKLWQSAPDVSKNFG